MKVRRQEGPGNGLLKPHCFGVQLLGKDSQESVPSKASWLNEKSWVQKVKYSQRPFI